MPFVRSRTTWAWAAGFAAVLVIGVILARRSEEMPRPATQIIESMTAPARGRSCLACHESQVRSLESAPHWNTLTPAVDESVIQRFAGQSIEDDRNGALYEFFVSDSELWCRVNLFPNPVRIDWVFGSGSHAQTPVSIQTNAADELELIEHRVSWYPNHGLGWTLGQNDVAENVADIRSRLGLEHHGTRHGTQSSLRCFHCHAARFHAPSIASPDAVASGLGCVRCHTGSAQHIQEQGGDAGSNLGPPHVKVAFQWSGLSARESVNRCGECHRRADETPADEIRTDAEHIVRFAPVGLVQSLCFLGAEQSAEMRLDCMTCHDPHSAARKDKAYYAEKCRSCHDQRRTQSCSDSPQSNACTDCHMPKRETQAHLLFTDHWIRRRNKFRAR